MAHKEKGIDNVLEFDKRIESVKAQQDINYQACNTLEHLRGTIEEAQRRSQAWLERTDDMIPRNPRMQARMSELWDNHQYAAQEAEKSLEEAFSDTKKERDRLVREYDNLIDEKKKQALKTETKKA